MGETTGRRPRGLKYEVAPCAWLTEEEVTEYFEEFKMYGEEEHVMWELEYVNAATWKSKLASNKDTLYGAFLVDDRFVGVFRISMNLKNEANGKVGLSIRPAERGRGYAQIMIPMVTELGQRYGVEGLTACVDERNVKSRASFEKSGWRATGRKFAWRPDPVIKAPRVAVEYAPVM